MVGVLHQPTTANAQELNFSLKWGKEFEASRRSTLNDIVGHDASGIYVVKLRTGFSKLDYRPSKSIVVVASLDQKGNLTKKPIFNSKDVDVITVPKVCEQISNNEVVLFGQRKKTQQFGRLVFN